MNKELAKLKAEAEAQGWRIEVRKAGHLTWYSPAGGFVITSATPSDRRAIMNIRRDLRRYGLTVLDLNKKKK